MKYIRSSRAIFTVFILIAAGVGSAFAQPDEESVARMTELIAARPNSDNLYIQRGNIYLYLRRTAEALADVEKALSINPTSSDAYFLRGQVKIEQRDNDGAIADISQAIRSSPTGYPLAYLMRAELYEKKGDLRRAYADYVKLDELTDNPKAAQGTARLESKLKTAVIDPASPIPIETKGENKEAWAAFQTADKFIKKLDWQAAINEYSKAIALDPEFAVAYANRARIYGNISKFDLAIADYAEAIRLKPNYPDAFESRGGLYYIYNKPDLALADYTEAIRLVPNFFDAYLNRGRVYSQLNQNGKAIADWEKFLQLAPNSSNAELARDYLASIRRSTSSTSTANSVAASSPTGSSKCVSGDCRNGHGKIVLANGDIYEGDFANYKRDGQGTFTYENGNRYVGEFSRDKFNGIGTYYNKIINTSKTGLWKDNVFVDTDTANAKKAKSEPEGEDSTDKFLRENGLTPLTPEQKREIARQAKEMVDGMLKNPKQYDKLLELREMRKEFYEMVDLRFRQQAISKKFSEFEAAYRKPLSDRQRLEMLNQIIPEYQKALRETEALEKPTFNFTDEEKLKIAENKTYYAQVLGILNGMKAALQPPAAQERNANRRRVKNCQEYSQSSA